MDVPSLLPPELENSA